MVKEKVDTGLDEQTKNKIINLIATLAPEVKIILFGSRARGTHAQWSDVDIAVDAGKNLPHALVDEMKSVLAATNMPYTIEVVDFHGISQSMRESILKEGILWK